MITIPITINAGRSYDRIALGRRGENQATQVVFNVAWLINTYGYGTAQLAVIRPEEEDPYPAVVEQDDDARTVTWTLTNADTAIAGRGSCELFWYVGDTLAKSIVYTTIVGRDIGDVGDTPPDPYETWVEEVLAAGAQAQENADFLRNASATAVTLSAGSNASASVDDGVFTFGIPRGDKGETGAGAVMFAVEPSATSIVYDPNAEEGARINHTTLTLKAYKITGNTKAAYAPGYFSISWESPGSVGGQTYNNVPMATSHTFTLPSTLDASCILTAEISANLTESLAKITIPIVSSGLNGAQGPKGDTGAKGDTGETGATPDFSVGTVTTLEPGTSATATITGTAESPVLNLGIPKGAKGDTGEVSQAEFDALSDDVDDLKSAIDLGCITADIKTALLQLASKVAYIDEDGQDYYDDLYDALYNRYWEVTNNLTNCTTSNESVQTLKGGAYTATITPSTGYVMTGATVSITMGGNDITATAYSNGTISIPAVTGALVITITAAAKTVSSISAVYTQSGTVWDIDPLDSLKQNLVVTATYDDSSTAPVQSDSYALSGTLTAGTSTITVEYEGKTTTFTVTVTQALPSGYTLLQYVSADGNQYVNTNLDETQVESAEYEFSLSTGKSDSYATNGWHIFSSTNTYFPLIKGTATSGAERYKVLFSKNKGNESITSGTNTIYATIDTRYVIGAFMDGTTDVTVDGTLLYTLTAGSTTSSSNKFTLFTYGGGPTTTKYRFYGKLYWMKVYNSSGELLRYFIPSKNSSSVAGLYDPISETFYTSATGTALIAGEVA